MTVPISEINANYREYKNLISTGVLKDIQNPLFNAALTRVLILARDILAKSHKFGKRVSFTENMRISAEIKDVTDLVKFYRDAACHVDSKRFHDRSGVRFSFIITAGKFDGEILMNKHLLADFEDDICIFLADEKLYINRHLLRAYDEAIKNLALVVPSNLF